MSFGFAMDTDRFCLRQFDDPTYLGTRISWDKEDFERRVNDIFVARKGELVDGCVYYENNP